MGFPHAFETPKMVSGMPISLLKLFSLFRAINEVAITSYTASLVEVFPTLPVMAMILGLYFFRMRRASSVSMKTIIFLSNDFIVCFIIFNSQFLIFNQFPMNQSEN